MRLKANESSSSKDATTYSETQYLLVNTEFKFDAILNGFEFNASNSGNVIIRVRKNIKYFNMRGRWRNFMQSRSRCRMYWARVLLLTKIFSTFRNPKNILGKYEIEMRNF